MPSQRRAEEDPTSNDPQDSELSHWENLIFSFDMQSDENRPNNGSQGQSDSVQDLQTAALLAQLAGSNMFPPHSPYSTQSQRPPTVSGFNLQSNPRQYVPNIPYGSHQYPMFRGESIPPQNQTFSPPPPIEATGSRSRGQNSQAGPSTSNAAAPDVDDDDNDEYDDKRRRNTAASARFRIKKKQRALDLERSVSDLTGRAEELEREASDLRRENGWLKEIVMLKGGRLAGINLSGNMGYPEPGGQSSGRRDKRRDSGEEEEGSGSEQSGEDRGQGTRGKSKVKGKAVSKKK
ncbi:hypothetical protein C8F04DRAFT_1076574 [Mycena alexandri]|uniref:BZIP domain-containing protein n=1 Tax=Mycena alexandri TaxID=1745969 RepID=A0AAD6TAP8_9AGAR|nr:hypothetical protein C8F04DRAFT_1076574 [Mycena alexandri]